MSKHTPGPWVSGFGNGVSGPRAAPSCFWDGEDIKEFPIRSGDEVVAWVATTRLDGMEESDARLIAAAPDLLEALKVINMFLDDMHILPIDRTIHDSIIMKSLVLKVIAKATEGKE